MKRVRIVKTCAVCQTEFSVKPSVWHLVVTCSKPCSLRHRSNVHKDRPHPWSWKIGRPGVKKPPCTEEYRTKQRANAKRLGFGGRKGGALSAEHRQKISEALKGHKRGGWRLSLETRLRMSANRKRGPDNNLWRGGVTAKNAAIRSSFEYETWRREVFARDNYTCVHCGARGVRLHADHIKPFAFFPELRLEVSNGRTLCVPCHKATDTYLHKAARATHGIKILET